MDIFDRLNVMLEEHEALPGVLFTMIRSGAFALGVTEAESIRQCIHAAQTEEELEAAYAELEEPPSPLRPFYAPEGEG